MVLEVKKAYNKLKKGKNQYKFRSFSDRVKLVNVSILGTKTSQKLEPNETHFISAVRHFSDSEPSTIFSSLKRRLLPLSRSLPLLLLNQKEITFILCDGLLSADTTYCYKPTFSLIAALAQDLKSDFAYVDKALETLIRTADPGRPELLELVFTTICFLFKFLEEKFVRDFAADFRANFFVLLSSPKLHIRKFAAESCAYLMRKTPVAEFRKLLNILFDFDKLNIGAKSTKKFDFYVDGLSSLLFYFVKSPYGDFHSNIRIVVKTIFSNFAKSGDNIIFSIEAIKSFLFKNISPNIE
ncbi:hypothetical protein MHBO_002365, partial [Bonamia ostreae]